MPYRTQPAGNEHALSAQNFSSPATVAYHPDRYAAAPDRPFAITRTDIPRQTGNGCTYERIIPYLCRQRHEYGTTCNRFARRTAEGRRSGHNRQRGRGVVAFFGAMGAGKTTLIREICTQLGVADNVTSPTFALVNHYRSGRGDNIFHFDFYRIEKLDEAYDLGYDEYFDSGALCLVEWPEKIEPLLPSDTLRVYIETTGPDSRKITIG